MLETTSENVKALAGLQELFASATHDASAAMCRWTDGIITVGLIRSGRLPSKRLPENWPSATNR